jgi:hypothetical protein
MKPNLFLSSNDIWGVILCLIFSWFFLKFAAKRFFNDSHSFKLFLIGFYLRIIGLLTSAIFNLYIVKADSTKFFSSAKSISRAMHDLQIKDFVKIFYLDFFSLPFKIKCFFSNDEYFNLVYDSNRTLIHIAGIISYFTFDSYLAISFFFSLWAYIGLWLIYSAIIKNNFGNNRLFYIFIIGYPTLFFWTTGIMKEPICVGAIGILFYFIFNKFNSRYGVIAFGLLAVFSSFLLIKIKSYLFIGFILSVAISYFIYKISMAKKILRYITLLIFSTTLVFFVYKYQQVLQNQVVEIISGEITERITMVTTAQLNHGGSSYNLGEFELSGWGMVKYVLASINVALFRPYFWEYLNPLVLLSSLEGMLMMFMVLYILFKKKFIGVIKIFKNSFVLMFSFFYTIMLAIMVGGIAFNFGTLARYKVPLTPFFFIVFIILYSDTIHNRKLSKI